MTNAVTLASLANSGYLRNRIINGNMVIDQRNAGAAVTATSDVYTLDRWAAGYSSPINAFTVQQSTTVPANFKNSLLATMGTGAAPGATGYAYLRQAIEGLNVSDLNWGTANAQTITISFWVRCSIAGTYGFVIRNSAADRAYGATYTINSANTFEYKTVTIAGDTSGTWLTTNSVGIMLLFDLGVGTTYSITAGSWQTSSNLFGVTGTTKLASNTGATFYITGVQLEVGTQATPFEWRPYTTELQLCQRYYEKSHLPSIVPGTDNLSVTDTGFYVIYGDGGTAFSWRVDKRAAPTSTVQAPLTTSSNNKIRQASNGTILTVSSITVYGNVANIAASGAANAYYYQIGWTATAEL